MIFKIHLIKEIYSLKFKHYNQNNLIVKRKARMLIFLKKFRNVLIILIMKINYQKMIKKDNFHNHMINNLYFRMKTKHINSFNKKITFRIFNNNNFNSNFFINNNLNIKSK
jgi:hypothetical protein